MERLEIAVVGAGPAGATAARLLAERGAHVTLLEARPLPRRKLCGGGLTPKALPYLSAGSRATIERQIERVELVGSRLPAMHLHLPDARVAMVERAPFDLALVRTAAEAGVDVRDAWPVHNAAADIDGTWLSGPRGRLHASVVVAADGEPSRIAQRLGLGGAARRRALALEVDLPFANGRRADELQLRFGLPGGYAWYFPKGDHANVGILTWRPRHQAGLRDSLRRYVSDLGLSLGRAEIKGHWIPQGLRRQRMAGDRVLLVGDAAGASDPFFGEGISYAMASAVVAADTIEDWANGPEASLLSYDGRLRATLGPAMRRLGILADMADRAPSISLAALRFSGWVRNQATRAVEGDGAPFLLPRPRALPAMGRNGLGAVREETSAFSSR